MEFKEHHGLDAANKLVANISAVLRQVFRRGIDLVAKYDDERFIVISTGMAWEEAEIMGDRLKRVVDEELYRCNPSISTLYASVGVATQIPEKGLHVDYLIEASERALAEAYKVNKGSVVIAESDDIA